MNEQNPQKKQLARFYSRGTEERLIRALEKGAKGKDYEPVTFLASAVERVKRLDGDRSLLLLYSGVKIPVALTFDDLERKLYRPDFKTDGMDILDLRGLTGRAALTPMEKIPVGERVEDGSICLGYYEDKVWFVTAGDAKHYDGSALHPNFNEAAQYAKNLRTHGHDDWEIPNKDILKEMFNSKSLGAFNNTYTDNFYWASTEQPDNPDKAAQQLFKDGVQVWYGKDDRRVVLRCVRFEA